MWPTSPAKPLVAAEQRPVEDDTGRDAGPDREEGDARPAPDPIRRPRSLSQSAAARASCSTKVGISKRRLHHRPERQVGDAEVDGHADRAVLRVDAAGDRDADRDDVLLQVASGAVDECDDLVDER